MEFRYLPKPGLMDTVRTDAEVSNHHGPRRTWYGRKVPCLHKRQTPFLWIDHRAGPGSFADTWQGVVCCDCRAIMRQTLENPVTAEPVIARAIAAMKASYNGGRK